ncbi:peptidase domain-containing ABC transporter [uncultured Duncaniella sp.]|uniref:peptidase domain-containing ABC transporter n=1 Tax=uncultured Duncaniella sp. TaxID=2768039 RepID=UPI0023D4D186|nr:peptidase domain-containing ABC transporter [uncultured Duncaniella sp.]MDE5671846.1 peptidase domain-containing ABC transporter [Duncaniella sp.]
MSVSFPFIKQHDAMQCGIASIAMISEYYGNRLSIAVLNDYCITNAHGVSLLAIYNIVEKLGFKARCVRAEIEDLKHLTLPAIIHWNQNHFVVLHKCDGKKFHVADPAKGLLVYSTEEFKKGWTGPTDDHSDPKGIIMLLEPNDHFGKINPDSDGERRSFRFLSGYLRQYSRHFGLIIFGLLLGCVMQLILPFLTQAIVDRGIRDSNINLIWLILLGELMIVIGRTATDFIRRWLLLHISMRINISLLSDFFIKLLKLPMSFFDTKLIGDLMQRMSDHSRVQSFLTGQVLSVVFTFLSFAVFGIVLFIYDKLIFIIFSIGSIIYGIWISTFLKRRKIIDYELFEQQAINQNKTYQFITSMQEIKLQDCERRRRWEWEDTQADLFTVQMKSLKLQQTQEAGSIFINEIKNILITVFAATAVINGQMTLGAMLAVQYIIGQLNSPVQQLMNFIYSLQDVKISLERINEIHEGRNEENATESAKSFPTDSLLSISLRNVSFKYDPHALNNVLNDISFDIPAGKVTAIVGASGSGKTTLIKLMLGYYPVSEGKISIAGIDIADYNLKWWRRQCGVVMQDGVIFSESIARNIAVDDNEIDTDRMHHAARIACIDDYIMSLPLRYDTRIGRDGVGLSKGQTQRILIARAVYRDPKFIFLDEATNSLDAKNEREIVSNLDDFYRGRTVVVVAHRLSTVRNADHIIVVDSGRIVETGTHESLIALGGTYYNLVKNQLELGN